MQPPYIVSAGPTHMYIGWPEPLYPNGMITGYTLYDEDIAISPKSLVTTFNYTNLQVSTGDV